MVHGKSILETQRLILTELTEQDREETVRLYCQVNPIVSKYMNLDDGFAAALYEVVWQEINRDALNWAIRDKCGHFMGRICIQHMSESEPELGIELFEEYRNKSYGPEA